MNERKVFSVRLRPGLWRRLKTEAKRTGMKLSALVELAIVRELERKDRKRNHRLKRRSE